MSKNNNEQKLKECLALACRAIERLQPPPFLGLIKLSNGDLYNHTSAKQLAGLNLAHREPPIKLEANETP